MIKFINLFLVAFSAFSIHAQAIPVSNLEFHATKNCPAYLSKNNQTNPNSLTTQPLKVYQVREINKPAPDWLRIEMAEEHTLRWVNAECGFTQQNGQAGKTCDSVGTADSYVLALSSQAGFCETYGYEAGKPECRYLSKDSYQANHLTLHGLWPNMDVCGQHYGFCGVRQLSNHCDYDPVPFSASVSDGLKKLMPSFAHGSCLERHEWNKHGSCQILSADDYFALAMRLTSEVDQSSFGTYLTQHQGQVVKLSELRKVIAQSFGATNSEKVYLGCKNGVLVDVYFSLPALLPSTDSLTTLINNAPNNHSRDMCGPNIIISHFNKDILF